MFTSDLEKHELIDFLTESPTKEIFHHENEAEYLHAIGKVTQAVKKFLNNNQQPFSGVSPSDLRPMFDSIEFEKRTTITMLYLKKLNSFIPAMRWPSTTLLILPI